jgi:hypothetical protein
MQHLYYKCCICLIDFALIKVEVSKQFEGLGKALSKHRRENAECGPQHRTARRLGALFEQVIPNIDTLAAAYGERVSEIATSSKLDLKVSITSSMDRILSQRCLHIRR